MPYIFHAQPRYFLLSFAGFAMLRADLRQLFSPFCAFDISLYRFLSYFIDFRFIFLQLTFYCHIYIAYFSFLAAIDTLIISLFTLFHFHLPYCLPITYSAPFHFYAC